MRLPRFAATVAAVFAVVTVSSSVVRVADAAPPAGQGPPTQQERSVPGHAVVVNPLPPNTMPRSPAPAPASWPAAAKSEVDLAVVPARAADSQGVQYQKAGALPVRVGRSGSAGVSARSAATVTVETFGQDVARNAGLAGTLLRVADAGGAAGEQVSVELDYSGFGQAYGGDYGSRLYLAEYPACVLTTPQKLECRDGKPIPSRNHARARTVAAEITLPGKEKTEGTVLVAEAGDSGSGGTYGATDLAPSGSWSAGTSSGDFTYSVPITMPPAPGGEAPSLEFGYSSGGVDGRTSATNAQASWVGDGWDISAGGFIERAYTGCSEDKGGNQGDLQTGDLCWKNENYTVSIGGISGKLIKDKTTGALRPERDDGSKIEHVGNAADGWNNDESWKVTSPDGTQYFLGLNRLPGWTAGLPETNSVFTEPVYGNHTGEPCNKPTFANSSCQQPYRWNVDLVVDPRGNAITYHYAKEMNYYKRGGLQGVNTEYVAAGRMASMEYGLRSDALFATAPARVLFQTADRCAAGDTTCDVPFDRVCNAGADCTGKYSPTFFTRVRLNRVVTQYLDAGGVHRDVDSWTLRQSLPPTGDGLPKSLWLDGITHTGHVGGTAGLPEIQFVGTALENRVDAVDNLLPITRYRLTRIIGSAGAVTEVSYLPHDCVRSSRMPANPETNTMRCYPTYWTPQGDQNPTLDWFHKYVVSSVSEDSRTGGPSISKTQYEYLSSGDGIAGGAWHYDSNVEAKPTERTWSEWRGYGRVRTIQGDASEPRAITEEIFLRGMDGDRLNPAGGARDVWVPDNDTGAGIEDRAPLAGVTRETLTYSGGRVVAGEIDEPNVIQTASDGTDTADIVGTRATASRSLQADGTWRRMRSATTEFTPEGLPKKIDDEGDIAVTGDESCTQNTYLRNENAWLLSYTSQVRTIAKRCDAWPGTADDVGSDVQSAYDYQSVGAAPTKGVVTQSKRWTGGVAYQTVSLERTDAYGRVVETTDVEGKKTTTDYSPATGNPTTVTTTNRVGWTTTSTMDMARGLPLTETGINGERSDLEYDPLGRLVRVWTPGWSKAAHPTKPTTEYAYEYHLDGPTVVTTKTLKENETYAVSYDLYDGLLRLRESQTPAVNGGRMITASFFNSRGQEYKTNGGYYNDSPPAPVLHGGLDVDVPNQTVTEYDDLGRPLETILKRRNVERWRTKTRYAGDVTYTTPPQGDTPTAVFKDAQGRIVERRQYQTPSATGEYGPDAPHDAMTYHYNAKGQLDKVTDAQSNQWTYEYDQLGRKKLDSDPDRGRTTQRYNALDQLESTTDAENRTVVHTYDDLGRPKADYQGTVSDANKLAEWTYDTLRRGSPTSATRFVNGNAYTQRVDQYDELNRPTLMSVVIPPAEGLLAKTYTYGASYSTVTGQLVSETIPGVGGLATENVIHTYNDLGLPDSTYGLNTYASEHQYSPYGETLRVTLGASPNKVWVKSDYEEGTRRLDNFQVVRDRTTQGEVTDRTFTYDPGGNLTKIADLPQDGTADTQCFSYDNLRRMTSAWTPGTGDCTANKTVASLGGAAKYWYDYTFDKIGNRSTQVQHTASGDVTETYAVPPPSATAVRPHAVNSVTKTGPTGSSRNDFTYDNTGNTRTRTIGGNQQTLDWNVEGRVSKVTEANGQKSEYVYDADGNRLLKKEPNATTLYLPGQEVVLTGTSTLAGKRYYNHGGSTVAMRSTVSGLNYLLTDHHGTDEMAIAAPNLFVTRRYVDPFGNARGPQPNFWPDDKGFVGGTTDTTGLTSVGAREYDSASGRFTSVDPVADFADPQQVNGYAYANNAPETASDPSGEYMIIDQEGLYRSNRPDGKDWTPAKQQKMAKYYKKHKAMKRVVKSANDKACRQAGLSKNACAKAKKDANSKKGFWDIMKEELPDILGDLTGFNDLRDCFTKGDLWACAGIIPWGKVLKLVKSVGKIAKAVAKAIKWEKRVNEARATMGKMAGRVNDFIRKGWKNLDDVAEDTRKGKLPDACHSFPPGTRVLMADGSSKPIEQVSLGDTVRTTDPATNRVESHKVVGTWAHDDEFARTEVTVDTDGPAGLATASLTATDWHPVWEPNLGAWVPIGNLQAGSWLQTSAGTWVQVTAVRHYTGTGTVHDLTVDGVHTYHVVAGGVAALVHNCGAGKGGAPSPDDAGTATVHAYGRGMHFSVETSHGDRTVHTDLDLDATGDTRIEHAPEDLVPTHSVTVDLPNARAAQALQDKLLKQTSTGPYNVMDGGGPLNNCLTHCMAVLDAGGYPVPNGSMRDAIRWARNDLFGGMRR
jgi:RHS repeat-associated protein